MTLVSVGNIVVDVLLRVPALPERGDDLLAASDGMTPGGSINTLIAATRQGLASAYAGGHGTGPLGDLVRATLASEGVGVRAAQTADRDSGFDIVLLEPDGERTFVTSFGAEAELRQPPAVADGDIVHVSGYGLLESTNASVIAPWLATLAEGVTVLFDPGPLVADIRAEVLDAVRARADWLSCNERESVALGDLTGWRHVIVRQGAAGCSVDGEQVPGFAVNAIDTTGAGDTHVGAFLAALADALPPVDAARRANAVAALSVTRRGPSTAPTAAEVDALLF